MEADAAIQEAAAAFDQAFETCSEFYREATNVYSDVSPDNYKKGQDKFDKEAAEMWAMAKKKANKEHAAIMKWEEKQRERADGSI